MVTATAIYWPQGFSQDQKTLERHLEGKNLEVKTLIKTKGTRATRTNISIKCETTRKTEVNEKETEPHELTDLAKARRIFIPCWDIKASCYLDIEQIYYVKLLGQS